MIIIKSRAFRYVKFWKSVFPTLFKYRATSRTQVTNRKDVFSLIRLSQL